MAIRVVQTCRFSVIDVLAAAAPSPAQPPLHVPSSGQRVVVVGGGRKPTLEDVVKVARWKFSVQLDEATLDKVNEAASKSGDRSAPFDITAQRGSGETTSVQWPIPEELSRSGVFVRILRLMQGRSNLRAEVLELLAEMLNCGVVPCFSSLQSSGEQLVRALMCADGFCFTPGGIVSTCAAFESYGLIAVELSSVEAETMIQSEFLVTGVCAEIGWAAGQCVAVCDVFAAMSCEAIGAPDEPFKDLHFDVCRPQRGMITSAANLRLMLEGSKAILSSREKSSKKLSTIANWEEAVQNPCFRCIPQIHGPAIDAVQVVSKSLEIELSSVENGSVSTEGLGAFDPQACWVALATIVGSLEHVGALSCERSGFLGRIIPVCESPRLLNANQKLQWAFEVLKWVESVGAALQTEILTSLQILHRQEQEQSTMHETDGDVKERAQFKPKDENEDDLSKLSEEKRAKIEAKRKAKAEKEAAKAAKRKQSKGLVLGVGTVELKRYVSEIAAQSPALVYDAFACGDAALGVYCSKLLERLGSGGARRLVKIPKGTRDYLPEQMRIREQALATIRRVFKRHGACEIDTPVFEMKETLTGKYGEDSKLIYDLADQGGELLSLRYDLTVPFARFLALNPVGNIKRYHIAKVYRRDNPVLSRGRYREFYQCDYDIAGAHTPLVPDAEVLTVACEILSELPIGTFQIKINHRRLLDAIFDLCGVPAEKFRPICSAVDKLDKEPWENVKREMVEDKGLPAEVADRIGGFVTLKGQPFNLHAKLIEENAFQGHEEALAAMNELHTLFTYLEATDSLQYMSFDLSLARGLDYYTGVIYEAVVIDGTSAVGSIAAGGRYDKLVGMFSGQDTPCVGVSIGVERVFTLMEKKAEQANVLNAPNVEVLVASIGNNLLCKRMSVCKRLWEANIAAEFLSLENPNLKKQLQSALDRAIPFMVIFGDTEIEQNIVKIKDLNAKTEVEVALGDVAQELIARGCKVIPAGADLGALEMMRAV